jgi:hypothetical protein
MKRLLRMMAGVALVVVIPAIYVMIVGWYLAADSATLIAISQLIGTATIVATAIFIIGGLFGVERQGFYIVAGGVVFLCADLLMWQGLGIKLGVRANDDGLIPLALVGIFLGPIYRLITMPTPAMPRDPVE